MSKQNACLEVTVVSEALVRAYARRELSGADRVAVKQTILEDDLARKVVHEEASAIDKDAAPADLAHALTEARNACRRAVVGYERLSQLDLYETVKEFAASRFAQRWTLLGSLTQSLKSESEPIEIIDIAEPAGEISVDDAIRRAAARDINLARSLKKAFDISAAPGWSARIADWIASVEADMERIVWLKSALLPFNRSGR